MVTLGGGLQAVESLPGGVPTYSLCISLPIFLYFSSHFGDGINLAEKHFVSYPARARSTRARRAHALRALGLLLADGTPTGGRGEDFLNRQPNFFTETAVTPERKVEKSFPRWEINRHDKG